MGDIKIDSNNKNVIIDDGVEKDINRLVSERFRHKVVFTISSCVALYLGYWSFSAGVAGFITFIFVVIPTFVFAFIYFSKIKRNKYLIKTIENPEEVLKEKALLAEREETFSIPENIETKSPFASWVLIWVTFGVYMFIWLYQMMRDINLINERPVFNIRLIVISAIFILITCYAGSYFQFNTAFNSSDEYSVMELFTFWVVFGAAVVWNVGIIYFLVKCSKQIAIYQKWLGVNRKASSGDTILFHFLGYASIPYVQSQFNSLISTKST